MFRHARLVWYACGLLAVVVAWSSLSAQTNVTLQPATNPSAGQPGVQLITVTGSNFPAGTIPATNVTVALAPATVGAGPSASAVASTVQTLVGSTRRITFQVPPAIVVAAPTPYRVSLSGTTSAGVGFASGNTAALTINPPPSLASLAPNTALLGQVASVALTATYTNFVQGSTQATFGAGVAVGGSAEGGFGPVTVTSLTTATAQVAVNTGASPGPRTVTIKTGVQQASRDGGFTIVRPNRTPTASAGGPYSGTAGVAIAFDASASSDPDGDPLQYAWTFGDGGTGSGATPIHTYASQGTFTATVTVFDGRGGSASASANVTVTPANRVPTASAGGPYSGTTGVAIAFDASGSSDPDGDPLQYAWTFGDGGAGSGATPSHTYASQGTFTAMVTVSDGRGGTATASAQAVITAAQPTVLTLAITEPAAGQVVRTPSITVRGTVSDPSARVIAQNVLATVTGQTFEAQGVTLVEGANQLVARARNDALQEATDTRAVALDTIPPVFDVNEPFDREVLTAASVLVVGTLTDAAGVTCSVGSVAASIVDRQFSANVTLSAGANLVMTTCRDAAGNASSRQQTLYFVDSPLAIVDVQPRDGAIDVGSTTPIVVTFSRQVDPSTVSPATLFVRVGATILPTAVTVSADGLTATLTPLEPLPEGRLVTVVATTGVEAADGSPLPTPRLDRFTTSGSATGSGVVIGEAYDDSRSLPLADATTEAISTNTGDVLATALTDARGRYLLDVGNTPVLIRVSKDGFTQAVRAVTTEHLSFAAVFDSRLTALAGAQTVSALFGGTIHSSAGDVLRIQPGAIAADAQLRVTSVSEQGPRALFPLGWSPLGIVDIIGPDGFASPATLELVDRTRAAHGRPGVAVRFDEPTARWIALHDVTVAPDGERTSIDVAGPGQYAVLIADLGEGAPPPAVLGQPLGAGSVIVIPDGAEGSGSVTPETGRGDDPTPAAALVTITAPTPLRSGTLLRGDFVELFILRDGETLAPLDTSQDLIAYRVASDGEGRTLAASFPIAPSRTFAPTELGEGTIAVSMLRSTAISRSVVGAAGGGVQTGDGSRVIVPPGAFAVDIPIDLRRVDSSVLQGAVPPGAVLVGALDLDLAGQTSSVPLVLSLGGSLIPVGSQVVVAEVRDVRGHQRLVFVTLAREDGSSLTTLTDVPGATVAGVRSGGRFAFLRFDQSLAMVVGTARDAAGRRDGHLVEIESFPFVSVTNSVGAFALPSPLGAFTIVATAAASADQVRASGITGTTLPEIVIDATPPRVESIVVRLPRIEGNVAGPVVLLGKPAPAVDDDALGQSSGNGNGLVEAGERIELTLRVRNDGTSPFNAGSFSLSVREPSGPVVVEPATIPVVSLPAEAPVTVGPFVFQAPTGVDAALLRYTLSFATAAGVSTVIPFNLPLGIDHWNVPVGSEITVRFSEPVVETTLDGGLTLAREDGAALVPVETRLFVAEDGNLAVLRPLAALAQDAVFRLTLTGAIVDADGRALVGAPLVERFRTEDRTPPAPIAAGRITATVPDASGFVTVDGTLGSVNPDDVVILLNETTGRTVLATIAADGSFTARVLADIGDRLVVLLRDRNGNETRVDPGPLLRRDPVSGAVVSAVIGRSGGTVTSADGVRLIVPAGALPAPTELSALRSTQPFALPVDLDASVAAAFASRFAVADRIDITSGMRRFTAPIRLVLPVPAGSTEGDLFLVVRSRTVTIGGPLADLDRHTGIPASQSPVRSVERLEVVESATVKNEGGQLVLSTDSPPFTGITGPGLFTIIGVAEPTTFFAGQVRRDSATGVPVSGAVVSSLPEALATAPFVTVTDSEGRFVVADALVAGPYPDGATVTGRLDVRDPAFNRIIRRDVTGIVGPPAPPATDVAHLAEPFVLPAVLPTELVDALGDLQPPTVEIQIFGPSFANGLTRLLVPLSIQVVATDDDVIASVGLELDAGDGFASVALTTNLRADVTPTRASLLRFRATARDRHGNITFADRVVRVVGGDGGGGGGTGGPLEPERDPEEPPVVVGIDPAPPIPIDATLRIQFSEPLDAASVTVASVRLRDPAGAVVPIEVQLTGSVVRVIPVRYLRLATRYTLELLATILDLDGQNLAAPTFVLPTVEADLSSRLSVPNAEDVALTRDFLVVVGHPDTARIGDNGSIRTYRVRDPDGNRLDPQFLGDQATVGRPLSVATDGDFAYVGNRFLGPIATQQPFFTPFFPGTPGLTLPETVLGCGLEPIGLTLCFGFTSLWETLPQPPSNVEVFDLRRPESPRHAGGQATGFLPATFANDEIWNPNTWPDRVEVTPQGIGVLNFLENFQFLTQEVAPRPSGVIGSIRRYGESTTETEFFDVAFFDGSAVALERSGARMVSTLVSSDPLEQERVITLAALPVGDGLGGRVGAVSGFEWTNSLGTPVTSDLAFVGTRAGGLRIFDVSAPHTPVPMGTLPSAFGSMSFDPCRGLAYLHGFDGRFHVVDFNDPNAPIELNNPGSGLPFGLGDVGSPRFNGNANEKGVVYLAVETGVLVVDIGVAPTSRYPTRRACDLTITPRAAAVAPREQRTFTASSGRPPYRFEVAVDNSGSAQVTPGGLYTAGPNPGGTDTLRVTDASTPPDTADATLDVVSLRIREAYFLGDHPMVIDKDDGSGRTAVFIEVADPAPVWLDDNTDGTPEINYLIAYTRSTSDRESRIVVVPTFEVRPALSAPLSVTINGVSTTGLHFSCTGAVAPPNDKLTCTATAVEALPSSVSHFEGMGIVWTFSTDGQAFHDAGTSRHRVFITFADPVNANCTWRGCSGRLHATFAYLATTFRNATDEVSAVINTWGQFSRNGGPTDVTSWDGRPLRYYPQNQGFPSCDLTAVELLRTGNGQCGSFAYLLLEAWMGNGIWLPDDINWVDARPRDGNMFLVKDWNFLGAPMEDPACATVADRVERCWRGLFPDSTQGLMVPALAGGLYGDLHSLDTVPGQHSDPPSEKAFAFHFIVRYRNFYLDPSYGLFYLNADDFERKAIDGYMRLLNQRDSDTGLAVAVAKHVYDDTGDLRQNMEFVCVNIALNRGFFCGVSVDD